MKIFGTSERTRSPLAPDLPSLAEHPDLKDVNMTVWYGLFAPAGINLAIVARISTYWQRFYAMRPCAPSSRMFI